MLRFVKQKIKNQIWLSLCLILGMALLVAIFCCQPSFKSGAVTTLLQGFFEEYIQENNEFPASIKKAGTYANDDSISASRIEDMVNQFDAYYRDSLSEIPAVSDFLKITTKDFEGTPYDKRNGDYSMGYIRNLLDHVEIVKGEYKENRTPEGYYPCLITELTMDRKNLTVGQVVEFEELFDSNGDTLKIQISGVFKENSATDLFWSVPLYENYRTLFVSKQLIDEIFSEYKIRKGYYDYYLLLDYTKINGTNVEYVSECLKRFRENDPSCASNLSDIFKKYFSERTAVSMMIWVLSLPLFGMVLAFIYMVSGQIVEVEKNEIATLKSRGVYRRQVILIYTVRSFIIAIFGLVVGLPLGYGFSKLAASTTDFLTFEGKYAHLYGFVPEMISYALVAALIGILFVLFPVILKSKKSIVEVKADYKIGKRMLWEKCFLDVLLLLGSIYLLYNFNKTSEEIRMNVLSGNKMDPLVFLNTCLFIIAAGLIAFRCMHYFVSLVYRFGKKRWKPVSYVSLLQTTRTFKKQTFISVFMILTVAMGLFDANVARTINQNREDRILYNLGAEATFKETWTSVGYFGPGGIPLCRYIEPDYERFQSLVEQGICESYTKVIKYPQTRVEGNRQATDRGIVLGIDTKEFGQTAYLKDEYCGDRHWYYDLNALARQEDGAIISQNLAEKMGLEIGSTVKFYEMKGGSAEDGKEVFCTVVGIVEAWPGFEQYYYKRGEEQERYLMVINQAYMLSKTDVKPYEIWVDLKDGVSAKQLYDFLSENMRPIASFSDVESQVVKMKSTPRIQITNGIFTLSFIVALVLCGVGFLIFWISSIGQRELLFGVYRAMGFSVGEVNAMLLYEHAFSTFLAVLSGGVVGFLSTMLFVKLYGIVYLPESSNLKIFVSYELSDISKLFAIVFLMIVICLLIIRRQIRKMNITQALKLGED